MFRIPPQPQPSPGSPDPDGPGTALIPFVEADPFIADKVLAYRCKRLLDFGMTLQQARNLALDRSVDLHFVEGLISRGCSVDTAFDIAS